MASLVFFVVDEERHQDQVVLLKVLDQLNTFLPDFLVLRLQLPREVNVQVADFLRFSTLSHFIRDVLLHDFVVLLQD